MIEIKRLQGMGYESDVIEIISENVKIEMIYGGVLDLFWVASGQPNKRDDNFLYYNLEITKLDYEVYELIDILYNQIVKVDFVFNNLDMCSNIKEYEDLIKRNKELKKRLLKSDKYKKLVNGNKIIWFSDDCCEEENSLDSEFFPPTWLIITKKEDSYDIEFKIKLLSNIDKNISPKAKVRIRNNGSYYNHFNVPFMLLFNKLQDYELLPYHQMHIEEYDYQMKLTKNKTIS